MVVSSWWFDVVGWVGQVRAAVCLRWLPERRRRPPHHACRLPALNDPGASWRIRGCDLQVSSCPSESITCRFLVCSAPSLLCTSLTSLPTSGTVPLDVTAFLAPNPAHPALSPIIMRFHCLTPPSMMRGRPGVPFLAIAGTGLHSFSLTCLFKVAQTSQNSRSLFLMRASGSKHASA